MVTARWDRNSAMGAWNYTVPLDASTGDLRLAALSGHRAEDSLQRRALFPVAQVEGLRQRRGRRLFVHLFSGTHFITGSHGPTRGMATGGLRFWKDGRDVPDVMLGLFDYPEGFNLSLRVNFVDGGEESEGLDLYGLGRHDGDWRERRDREPRAARNGAGTTRSARFTEAMQKEIHGRVRQEVSARTPDGSRRRECEKYVAPQGYSDSYDHFKNFFAVGAHAQAGGGGCGVRISARPARRC